MVAAFASSVFAGPLTDRKSQAEEEPSEALSVRSFFGNETTEVFRLSPNGRSVAFLQVSESGSRLCVGEPENLPSTTNILTESVHGNVFSFLWVDNQTIAFSSRVPGGGTLTGSTSIFSDSAQDHRFEVSVISEANEQACLAGICLGFNGNPSIVLAVPSKHEEGTFDLVLSSTDGKRREIIYENTDRLGVCSVSRDGKTTVGVRCNLDGTSELIVSMEGRGKALLHTSPDESLNIAAVSPDGRFVYTLTNAGNEVDRIRLERLVTDSGSREVLAEDPEKRVDIGEVLFTQGGDTFLGARYFYKRATYEWSSKVTANLYFDVKKLLPDGDIKIVETNLGNNRLLVSCVSDNEPEAEYFYNAETSVLTRLDSKHGSPPKSHLAHMTPVTYRAHDGTELTGYLTLPAKYRKKKAATIVFPHGGPNKRNFWGYDPRVQFLASRGYAVFQPNFRGSSGFGKHFQNAGNKQWGRGVMQDDITDGVRWLIKNKISDPDKIAIFGGSYGGFAALAGVTFTPDLYAAGISLFGASDLIEFVKDIPPDWRSFQGHIDFKIGNHRLPTDVEMMFNQSPVNFVGNIKAPLLVYQGSLDHIVKRSQADAFVSKCRKIGKSVDYLLSQDEGHGFSDPTDEQAVYFAIEQFLAPILGGLTQENSQSKLWYRIEEFRKLGREIK